MLVERVCIYSPVSELRVTLGKGTTRQERVESTESRATHVGAINLGNGQNMVLCSIVAVMQRVDDTSNSIAELSRRELCLDIEFAVSEEATNSGDGVEGKPPCSAGKDRREDEEFRERRHACQCAGKGECRETMGKD